MKLCKGNMWDYKTQSGQSPLFVVTTNSYINKQNELVMGRGAALEAKQKMPWLAFEAAIQINNRNNITCNRHKDGASCFFGDCCGERHYARYGFLLVVNCVTRVDCGIFQVKYHFRDQANLDLIQYSTGNLMEEIERRFRHKEVVMNFPGIGYGGLKREEVLPIIQGLQDNVFIYERE